MIEQTVMTKHEQALLIDVMTNLPDATDEAILDTVDWILLLAVDLELELQRRRATAKDAHGRERQGADG